MAARRPSEPAATPATSLPQSTASETPQTTTFDYEYLGKRYNVHVSDKKLGQGRFGKVFLYACAFSFRYMHFKRCTDIVSRVPQATLCGEIGLDFHLKMHGTVQSRSRSHSRPHPLPPVVAPWRRTFRVSRAFFRCPFLASNMFWSLFLTFLLFHFAGPNQAPVESSQHSRDDRCQVQEEQKSIARYRFVTWARCPLHLST